MRCVWDSGHHWREISRLQVRSNKVEVIEQCIDCQCLMEWDFDPSKRDGEKKKKKRRHRAGRGRGR
jgi:hypothetical protein